ncbi:conserved hypothetical protein [Pediculus humanus corporis]|uniref:Uncharacterized protein n=1 Tax=Pediculus humanus subsp. corporis TaxID=121224 RepID=E0V9Y0_PEDHC|nr:uncharacterized protein Phum_PHUM024040 [Pediculus humanus corporis]EEB10186.1 conserved hypothetical protein [Pediculus humanus corporis]
MIREKSGVDATFHFFASKKDENEIRGALKKFKEKEENILGIKSLTLRQDSSLFIESVSISKKSIRVGQGFSISCIAQGSIYMTFTWLKDGAFINESVITRSVSMHLIYLSRGRYQYTLVMDKANLLDEGIYTCHVSDWHVQQCKGIHVNVAGPPEIRLSPMSATVEKGANLDIVCIPLNNRPKLEKFGYSWIKNKHLLKMMPGREVWEDLYLSHYNGEINTGSVLEITNIQKSATYTCQAQGTGASSELSVHVEVVNKTVVPLCPAEGKYGIAWQTTAPGMETVADCPFHAGGHAKRECRLTDYNTTEWDVPNFTGCLTSDVEAVYNNFKRLTLGYEVTNGSSTLGNLLYIVSKRSTYLPGECERILDILDEKIIQLQALIKSIGIIWGSLFTGSSQSVFQDMTSLIININKIPAMENGAIRYVKFPPDDKIRPFWFKDKILVRLNAYKMDNNNNNNNVSSPYSPRNFSVLIAAYKNMTQFLKARYLTKFDDGTDQEYEINSKLITIVFGRGRRKKTKDEIFENDNNNNNFIAEIDFNHLRNDYDFDEWSITCGVTEYASFRSTWNLNSCTSQPVNSNVTKCICKKTGTFALLVVTKNQIVTSSSPVAKDGENLIVLIGCGCCLVQSLLTLCLLLPYWCRRKTCLVFLKMQCCLATACAMTVFMYSIRNTLSKAVFPLVTTFLEIFLLIGLSSHLSKILVVYTEIIQFPHGRHMKETVICIITGVPILAVLCNFLGYHSTGWNLHSWWIIRGSMIFNVFMTSAALLIVLFVFLYISILRQLNVISQRCANKNKTIFRR